MISAIKVSLYGNTLGFIAENKGQYVFKYDKAFRSSGLQPSPIKMDTQLETYSFPELKRTSFEGLPGLIRDSIPDHYGTQVIEKYFSSIGVDPRSITALDKLAYIGDRGFGALSFEPAKKLDENLGVETLDLFTLWEESRSVLYDDGPPRDIGWVFSFGGSAGGARAKAAVMFNTDSREFSIQEESSIADGAGHWLLKFDGLSKDDNGKPMPYERMEYIYSLLAKDAGLDVPETSFVEEQSGMFHFLTKRFDRSVNEKTKKVKKLHLQTVSALLHHDHNDQQSLDYIDVLTALKMITGSAGETLEGFRRLVFNVLSHNHDDHSKNLSLTMDVRGRWSLSPAYDIVYTNEKGWFKNGHQITVNQKAKAITQDDVLQVAEHVDIPNKKATDVIDDVQNALLGWEKYAAIFDLVTAFPKYVVQVRDGLDKVRF